MEHLILLVLCCIFVGITTNEKEIGLAMIGGVVIFGVLLVIDWMTPGALSVLSAALNSGERFTSRLWVSLLRS
jgi:hypothetical protein